MAVTLGSMYFIILYINNYPFSDHLIFALNLGLLTSKEEEFVFLSVWFCNQLSRVYETIEHEALEITNYFSQLEKPEEMISDLQNTIVDSKPIPNSKSSEEDINQLQSKILELSDADRH